MALYDIENMSFTYWASEKQAVTDVSLQINEGEFIVLCGQSGCGKTTLLRQLKTVMTPYGRREGQIYYQGRRIEELTLREQAAAIGYVLQHPEHQIVTDKVWHELSFGLENLGFSQEAIALHVAEMSDYLGISDWYHRDVSTLSGGQKQLMNLAAVLVMQPQVLILDEPTSQLDPLAAEEFVRIIHKISVEFGTTVIFSAHRLDEVTSYADRVIVMENGRILADGTPRRIGAELVGNPMERALPVPVRIALALDKKKRQTDYPLTIREGRDYLARMIADKERDDDADCVSAECKKQNFIKQNESRQQKAETVIKAKNLWFRYEKNGADVISDLSLEVRRGEIYALLGANGSGKTTTISMLAGIKKPYRGQIEIAGKKLGKYKKAELFHHLFAMLPQDVQTLFVGDSVGEDLRLMQKEVRTNYHQSAKESEELFADIIEQMQLQHLLQMHPYDLSGGEAQRVALARILLLSPQILLLDEPTKGMDACYKQQFGTLLRKLQKKGITILFISHDVEFSADFADTCGLLFQGQIVAQQPTREFFAGNSFYTTASNRVARRWYPHAITVEDVAAEVASESAICGRK